MEQNEKAMEKQQPSPKKEWILAGLVIVMAYFYLSVIRYPTELARLIWWKAQLNTEYLRVGLAWMVFTGMFLGTGLWYVSTSGAASCKTALKVPGSEKKADILKRLPKGSWVYFGLTVAAGIWFPFYMRGDQDVLFYMLLFLHGVAVYWLLSVTGSIRGKELDERGIGDLFRGFFVLPFSGYPQFFITGGRLGRFLWQSKNAKNGKAWQVGLGLLISVPVLCIAIPILRSADAYFDFAAGVILPGLIDVVSKWELMSLAFTALWTLVLAGYFFGLFHRAVNRKRKAITGVGDQVVGAQVTGAQVAGVEVAGAKVTMDVRRQIPQMVLVGFLIPILMLYLLFFVVRLLGINGAMDQIAAGDLWISTYARDGFFELCWIAAINFLIFTVARWYSPRAGKGMRLLIGGLGMETMAFVGLAFSKMWYYIQAYESFTFKRAMCCWLLLTLLVTFGLMTLELWHKKIKGIKWGVWFGSVTFLLMAYSNMSVWAP